MLAFVQRGGPLLNASAVEALERSLQIRLPDGFRNFLLENNGGSPMPNGFTFVEGGERHEHVVHEFFGVGMRRDDANIERNFDLIGEDFERKLCPFGRTPTGEILCLGVAKENWNSVVLYDYRTSRRGFYRVQDSFEKFLDELHPHEVPDEPYYQHIARNFSLREIADRIRAGENLNMPDDYDRTLLEWAAICNRIDIVRFLVERNYPIRQALAYAESNHEFFPEFKPLVSYLRSLRGGTRSTGE